MTPAYYNENDPFAAQWLMNLIAGGMIAPGIVDTRSISDVKPSDLTGFTQCHFFAGIGVWSYALRLAGWSDDRPVWTGSCPCQPFSSAGKGKGTADERHLWPHWFHLVEQCGPADIFGEQVASKDGLAWLDIVQADLEGAGYAVGAVDTCAAGFGAPHIRQRQYFYAHNSRFAAGWLADSERDGQYRGGNVGASRGIEPAARSTPSELGDTIGAGLEGHGGNGDRSDEPGRLDTNQNGPVTETGGSRGPRPTNGLWQDTDWLFCRDGKWRSVEPGTFPLVNGAPSRVGRLRGYGNAVTVAQATGFIEAAMEYVP